MSRGLTEDQMEYFEGNLGVLSLKNIAKNLGKQPRSLEAYRNRNGIPTCREMADGVPIKDFAKAVGVRSETVYKYWIKIYDLPVKNSHVGLNGNKEMFVNILKFWDWAYLHKSFIDFSEIEFGILGSEPGWVKEMRQMDATDWGKKGWSKPWTPEEDRKLHYILSLQKYDYREISDIMQRTELGIQCRVYKTGEKLRPIEEPQRKWSTEEISWLEKLICEGYSAFQISRKMDRSEISIKTKIGRLKARDR